MIPNMTDFSYCSSHIEIRANGCHATITINGHELKGVRAYELTHTADGLPVLKLDLNALDITFDANYIRYLSINGQELDIRYKHKESANSDSTPNCN